jgi:uroporphyrinogen-III synthase
MKLLVTRPEVDADALTQALVARGHDVLAAPLLTIEFIPAALPDLTGVAALIFTSANGVRAFVAASGIRDLPCYAVGDRTAAALQEAGFTTVESAGGDVASLAALIIARQRRGAGRLIHVAGSHVAGDLAGSLQDAGFTIERAVLYEARSGDLDAATIAALKAGEVDGVLLFSPRTAQIFVEKISAAGLASTVERVTAWCLSAAVAAALTPLDLAHVRVPATPTQEALLELLDAATPQPAPTPTVPDQQEDIPLASLAPAPSPIPKQRRRWPLYAIVVVVAVASGAASARYWIPERWLVAHGWLTPPGEDFGGGPGVAGDGYHIAAAPDAGPILSPVLPPPVDLTTPTSPPPTATDPRVDGISQSLLALQRKVADLAERAPPDRGALDRIIADQRSLGVSVAALETRITAIEKALNEASGTAAVDHSLLLAAEDLRQSLMSSAPYAGPYAVLKTLGDRDPQVAALLVRLHDRADTGIPSRVVLAQRLGVLADALAAPPPLPAAAAWWRRLLDQIERLVVIRHITPDDATTTPEGTARLAAADLEQGDLPGAITRLSGISGAAAAQVSPWLADARARLDAESAADRLIALLSARVATPTAIGTAP